MEEKREAGNNEDKKRRTIENKAFDSHLAVKHSMKADAVLLHSPC